MKRELQRNNRDTRLEQIGVRLAVWLSAWNIQNFLSSQGMTSGKSVAAPSAAAIRAKLGVSK